MPQWAPTPLEALVDGMRSPISRSTDTISKNTIRGLSAPLKKEVGQGEEYH